MRLVASLLLMLASLAASAAPWREVSSPDLAREMAPGWNLGVASTPRAAPGITR